MNKFIIGIFLIFVSYFHNLGAAGIKVQETNITFNLSDSWDNKANILNRTHPEMTPSDPLYMAWKRKVIIDKNGNPISAGLNVTVFNVQSDTNIVLLSSALMHRRNWPFKQFLSVENDGLKLPNSLGYFTEFSPQNGLVLKMFVIHAIIDNKFVEFDLSATEDIFPQVESEMRETIKSLHLTSL